MAVPRSPLSSVLRLVVTLLWLRSQVQNIMFFGLVFLVTHREKRGVQQLSSWTVATYLRPVAQKLQWLCSFPIVFGGTEGFPQLPHGDCHPLTESCCMKDDTLSQSPGSCHPTLHDSCFSFSVHLVKEKTISYFPFITLLSRKRKFYILKKFAYK
jgi:hypothetical protein